MDNLVTGGAGFIGRHLVDLLLERGESVRVLDIDPGRGTPAGAEVVRGSITDPEAVREALKGVRRLFHLAGNPNLWARDKADFEAVNTGGTRVVLAEAERAGTERVVYTSTESILAGERPREQRASTDETVHRDIGEMVGPYCRSKFLAEQEAVAAAQRGLPVVVVNPTLPLGPGDHRITPPTRMLLGFLNGRYPAFLDCGLNMIDVRDVALGHVLAAERGKVGERYILGNRDIRLAEILEILHGLTGARMPRLRVPYGLAYLTALLGEFLADRFTRKPPNAPLTGVRLARHPTRFDATKAKRELGLSLRPFEETLNEAVAWMARCGLVHRALPRVPYAAPGLPGRLSAAASGDFSGPLSGTATTFGGAKA